MPAKERTLAQGNAVTTAQTATAARIGTARDQFSRVRLACAVLKMCDPVS